MKTGVSAELAGQASYSIEDWQGVAVAQGSTSYVVVLSGSCVREQAWREAGQPLRERPCDFLSPIVPTCGGIWPGEARCFVILAKSFLQNIDKKHCCGCNCGKVDKDRGEVLPQNTELPFPRRSAKKKSKTKQCFNLHLKVRTIIRN